ESHENFDLLDGSQPGKKGSVLVTQTEDEIAAITMATGAALAGARAATSTSGPGFSLMVEGLGWAGMNEVPVVITQYSRGGPSTGQPTRHEQGDPQIRTQRLPRRVPPYRPLLRRPRRMLLRRDPNLQLRRTIPDAFYTPHRQVHG